MLILNMNKYYNSMYIICINNNKITIHHSQENVIPSLGYPYNTIHLVAKLNILDFHLLMSAMLLVVTV